MRTRVIQRRYWHIADIPLVVNEWSPESALQPPDLSAMPIWIDLKGVPSMLFSQKALKCLSRAAGKFVKLHPSTEKCLRLDVARVLVEVDLHKPLVERISFADKNGVQVLIDVCYPWLPPKCSICNAWGHKGAACNSRKIKVLQKEKEIVGLVPETEVNGDVQDRYAITPNKNAVSDLLHELEAMPPALESNEVEVKSNDKFEVGGSSSSNVLKLDWILTGRKSSPHDRERVTGPKEVDQREGDMVISPSRFSVLATEDTEERDGDGDDDPDDIEEGQVISEVQDTDSKKDTAKNVKFRAGTSLKLSKQLQGRGKEMKGVRTRSTKKASTRKL
ncbi:uncharacterized protein LOC106378615 [Brassica napus]|uniref:uncharacterized protein LOC106378615 n=1 Tax=Brassica napus TaxID=3708 RepID=UPI002079F158|nr:uncharacterized protein LOC106378615 [Brassica napus]